MSHLLTVWRFIIDNQIYICGSNLDWCHCYNEIQLIYIIKQCKGWSHFLRLPHNLFSWTLLSFSYEDYDVLSKKCCRTSSIAKHHSCAVESGSKRLYILPFGGKVWTKNILGSLISVFMHLLQGTSPFRTIWKNNNNICDNLSY